MPDIIADPPPAPLFPPLLPAVSGAVIPLFSGS
jgi:hypothetical protein